jgi:hypothetical protein
MGAIHPSAPLGTLIERMAGDSKVGLTGVLDGLADARSISRWILGVTMSAVPDPASWFEAAWRRMMPARDCLRHWRIEDPVRDENPPLLLVVWSLYGLSYAPPGSDAVQQLWRVLERAVREGLLTDSARVDHGWQVAHQFLGATWALNFPEDPPTGASGSLDSFVAPFIRPEISFAELVLTLRTNGVSTERLVSAIGNAERARRLLSLVANDIRSRALTLSRGPGPYANLETRVRDFVKEIEALPHQAKANP